MRLVPGHFLCTHRKVCPNVKLPYILPSVVPVSLCKTTAGDAGEGIVLAPPDSCVAMEASVAGLPSDALKAIDDIGDIERLDDSSLAVR